MVNVVTKVEKNKLILEVDLSKEIGPSATGKTIIIGSTQGSAKVPGFDGVSVNLSVYRKAPK